MARSNYNGLPRGAPKPISQAPVRNVKAPVAQGKVRRMVDPKFLGINRRGDIVIQHREYISDVSGSVSFAASTYSVNPGLPGTFPWLSAIAARYESYRFRRLVFCYETSAATTATGTVIGVVDYDASDSAPENKTQALAYRSAVRSPAWAESANFSVGEDLHKRNSYYVRRGAAPSNTDVKLYDVGTFFLCTKGQAGPDVIGEIYVDYIVELMTPEMGSPGAGVSVYGAFSGTANSTPASNSSGIMPVTVSSAGTTSSATTWTFTQPWEGIVSVSLVGTGITGTAESGTATSVELREVINAAATQSAVIYSLSAQIGQTFILTISNTTLTATAFFFSQANV